MKKKKFPAKGWSALGGKTIFLFAAVFFSFLFPLVCLASINMNLKISQEGQDLNLTWDKVSTAHYYKVYKDKSMPTTPNGKIEDINITTYTFKGLAAESHTYTVHAYDSKNDDIGEGEKKYTASASGGGTGSGSGVEVGAPFPNEPSPTTLPAHIKAMFNWATGIGSALAILMIIIAGLKYMTSAGNTEALSDAKDTIVGALIGLAIIILINLLLQIIGTTI